MLYTLFNHEPEIIFRSVRLLLGFQCNRITGRTTLQENWNLVSLSEQNLVDCSGSYGNYGCEGGLKDNAFRYIKANGGIDTEESYPYEAMDGPCRFQRAYVGATVTGKICYDIRGL